MENSCMEHNEEIEECCASRLDLKCPLNYAVVPEHVDNCVTTVNVPLLNIYSMETDSETFSKINHFQYVPFSSEILERLKKTAYRKYGMCHLSYHLNEESMLLNYNKYLWYQHGTLSILHIRYH